MRSAHAQRIDFTPVCNNDTITVNHRRLKEGGEEQYRVVTCVAPSRLGIRVELGAATYRYRSATRTWLGNHSGPQFTLAAVYDRWTLGLKFKPWTLNPQHALLFQGDTLTTAAELNPVKLDYYLSYSFHLTRRFSMEPYLGYNRHRFLVINEEALNKDFDLRTARGWIAGISLNRYFRTKHFNFIALFVSTGYSSARFDRVHSGLDNGYVEGAAGIAFKGFNRMKFTKRVDR